MRFGLGAVTMAGTPVVVRAIGIGRRVTITVVIICLAAAAELLPRPAGLAQGVHSAIMDGMMRGAFGDA